MSAPCLHSCLVSAEDDDGHHDQAQDLQHIRKGCGGSKRRQAQVQSQHHRACQQSCHQQVIDPARLCSRV
jgi:hypothetical protein